MSSVPPVVLDHVGQLDDKFALLVLLTALEGMLIFPAQCGFTILTVDIGHSMKTCQKDPLLCWTTPYIHH